MERKLGDKRSVQEAGYPDNTVKKLSKKSCTKLLKSKNLCFLIGMHPNYLGK